MKTETELKEAFEQFWIEVLGNDELYLYSPDGVKYTRYHTEQAYQVWVAAHTNGFTEGYDVGHEEGYYEGRDVGYDVGRKGY